MNYYNHRQLVDDSFVGGGIAAAAVVVVVVDIHIDYIAAALGNVAGAAVEY